MKNEKEVCYAPIVIESADQLEMFGIRWKDCKTWVIGGEKLKVYLIPAPPEVCEYLTQQIYARHSRDFLSSRCLIPGKKKSWIRCPSTNSCSSCPFGLDPSSRLPASVSLEALSEENGWEMPAPDLTEETVLAGLRWEAIRDRLEKIDPVLVRIIEFKAAGFSVEEIASKLGVSAQTVYRALTRIRSIAENLD